MRKQIETVLGAVETLCSQAEERAGSDVEATAEKYAAVLDGLESARSGLEDALAALDT